MISIETIKHVNNEKKNDFQKGQIRCHCKREKIYRQYLQQNEKTKHTRIPIRKN